MSDSFRALLQRAADHAADYREQLPRGLARPQESYAEARQRLRSLLPETGADPAVVLEELVSLAEPGLMPMAGPRFFGWVIGASHPVGVAADVLVAAWGQNAGYHTPTPSAS